MSITSIARKMVAEHGAKAHWSFDGTQMLCGRGFRTALQVIERTSADAEFVMCKSCASAMARLSAAAESLAHELDERRTMARAYLGTPTGAALTEDEISAALVVRDEENEAMLDAHAGRDELHALALKINVKWNSVIRLEGNGTTNHARLLTAAELRAELVNAGYPEPARPKAAAQTDRDKLTEDEDCDAPSPVDVAHVEALAIEADHADEVERDRVQSIRIAGDLAANQIMSGSYWRPRGWAGVSVRVSKVEDGIVFYRTNAGCGTLQEMPVAEFLSKGEIAKSASTLASCPSLGRYKHNIHDTVIKVTHVEDSRVWYRIRQDGPAKWSAPCWTPVSTLRECFHWLGA
jgi:hypothetical protein